MTDKLAEAPSAAAFIDKNVRFNFTLNLLEGGLFGLGLGFASYVTVIPLFMARLTESSILIGLIAAMRAVGWQLPQLLTSNRVARIRRYKPMSLLMTLNERLPFFGLVLVALALPVLGKDAALILTSILVVWQTMGGGLTGTAWQSMIAKIIPSTLRGRFYGAQSAFANLLSSIGAVIAGLILQSGQTPANFAICFLLAAIAMMIGFGFLYATREPEGTPARETSHTPRELWHALVAIMRRDANFRMFIFTRMFSQVAAVGVAFYTIYAVRRFNMDPGTAGIMTGVLLIGQLIASPLFGWLGDRYSHRLMFALGVLTAGAGAAIAIFAPSLGWFYLVFALAGVANAGLWPTIYALTLEFGTEAERPYYIGLANTLVSPATLLAPILGGALADAISYEAMFGVAAVSSVLTTLTLLFVMREPRQHVQLETLVPAAPLVE
ncbi:MAG: MFS transporter [Chloroflexi bacterium]|nr:MFS transporter [Chloroflexota bacterium]